MKELLVRGLGVAILMGLLRLIWALSPQQLTTALGWGASAVAAAAVLLVVAWLAVSYWKHFRPLRKKESGSEYVHVAKDGTVRELTEDERDYLQEEFTPFDGARPYIMTIYKEQPRRRSQGFIPRRRVPPHIQIQPLPQV